MNNRTTDLLILGGGLAGLSVARWTQFANPIVLEQSTAPGGHLRSDRWANATWDQGPHVSFTNDAQIQELLATDIGGNYREFSSRVESYDQGSWIPHPLQSHIYALPAHIRTAATESFKIRKGTASAATYLDWLHGAYGSFIAEEYMGRYTRKYWTCDPDKMGIDWIGLRMRSPTNAEWEASLTAPPTRSSHYISTIRYPNQGGFASYLKQFTEHKGIHCGTHIEKIDLNKHQVTTNSGIFSYEILVNTIPLPEFIRRCDQATPAVRDAAKRLRCTSLWLIDVLSPHPRRRDFHWAYIYDKDKLSTRVTHMDALAAANAPPKTCAIQVEVYDSPYRTIDLQPDHIRERVIHELRTIGLVECESTVQSRIRRIPYANILFDTHQRSALNTIWTWAETHGLCREPTDLHPLTDWTAPGPTNCGSIMFAGRFGQWKYYWTDDCIKRGFQIANALKNSHA